MRDCEICGSTNALREIFPHISKCRICGLGYNTREITEDGARRAYTEEYYTQIEYHNYLQDKAIIQKNFAKRIQTLQQWNVGGRLFEIGCAYGFFLELAQRHWQVSGCDVSESACGYARDGLGLNVVCGDFTEITSLPENSHDLICLWDTIEHLYNPAKVIARASKILKPDGLLCLTTGDFDSRLAKLQGRRWRLLHAPTHLYFFGKKSMTHLLNRSGFQIVNFEYEGYYRSLGFMLHRLLIFGKHGQYRRYLYALLEKIGLTRRDLYLNFYDIMFVVARKITS